MEKSTTPRSSRDGDSGPLMLPSEVRRRAFEAGVRDWRKDTSLAAATRRGDGPPGRVPLSGNQAAYDRAAVEEWLEVEKVRRAEKLAAMQARAAHAREVRAARRSAPDAEVAVALDVAEAAIAVLEAVAEGGAK